jgi:hypothetical protein
MTVSEAMYPTGAEVKDPTAVGMVEMLRRPDMAIAPSAT